MKKITKRDILFFITGFLLSILIQLAWDFEGHVQAFKDGFNDGYGQEEPCNR